jgi:hypothetical protein
MGRIGGRPQDAGLLRMAFDRGDFQRFQHVVEKDRRADDLDPPAVFGDLHERAHGNLLVSGQPPQGRFPTPIKFHAISARG